jgi:putative DNA primase/helicase
VAADRTAKQQGSALTADDAVPHPQPVNGAALLDEVAATIARYVLIPEPAIVTAARWIVMTYVLEHVPLSPRLVITSPTRECGKTRLLTLLAALVRRPILASSVTPAA